MIALIIALKLIACLISLASGFRGGLFFASLFVGSLLGKFFAVAARMIGPDFVVDPLVGDADRHGDARGRHRRRPA